jgi:hypothetical protein
MRSDRAPDWNRVLSLIIAVAWVSLEGAVGGAGPLVASGLRLLAPLACICFPYELSELTTATFPGVSGRSITTSGSPAGAIRFFGWVALLALTVIRVVIVIALRP